MSTINSETLINNFPQDRDTVQRLLAIFEDNQGRLKEFTLKRLFDRTTPRSELALAQILNHLVNTGAIKRIVRVESPNLGGLQDFSSLMEVPEVIHDWRRDVDMCVTPEDINILYEVNSDSSDSIR
jgi:hypothetical protein